MCKSTSRRSMFRSRPSHIKLIWDPAEIIKIHQHLRSIKLLFADCLNLGITGSTRHAKLTVKWLLNIQCLRKHWVETNICYYQTNNNLKSNKKNWGHKCLDEIHKMFLYYSNVIIQVVSCTHTEKDSVTQYTVRPYIYTYRVYIKEPETLHSPAAAHY